MVLTFTKGDIILPIKGLYIFLDSSMVEHSAVNRVVVGSSPTRGVGSFVRGAEAPFSIFIFSYTLERS